ncbi:MAG: RNA polymerase sigma factor RpoH [Candidatus Makana argininalis]
MIKTINKFYYFNKNLKSYLKIASFYPILTEKEEKYFTKKFYYNGDLESAKNLILSHIRFVIKIARNYLGYGISQYDLIQEGNIGLMKAVRRFNPNVGVRLISFAIHWIKAEIHEYVINNWRIVKVATTKSQKKLFFNLRKNKKNLEWFNKNEIKIISKKLDVKIKDVIEMESRMSAKDITFDPIYINVENNYKEINSLNPIIYHYDKKSNFVNSLIKHKCYKITFNKINIALSILDKRSQDIIKSRWLNDNNKTTLQKLAHKYGISAERIRQLEKRAMKKMKESILDSKI